MTAGLHPPQADMQPQTTSSAALQWCHVPAYEVVMGIIFALIGLIGKVTLIGSLLSGSRPSFNDLAITIAAAFIGTVLAILSFRSISKSWLRIKVQEEIEIYRWLRRSTQRVPRAKAQAVQLNMYVSPIFGVKAEAILILSGKRGSIDLPVLRHLFPSKKFRTDALNLAQALQVPLQIPNRNRIPLGFQSSFDALRDESSNLAPMSPAQKLQQQTKIDALVEKLLLSPVTWQATGNGEFPHCLDFDGQTFEIRVNDWPEYETVYSLLIAKQFACDLPSLPDNWKLPNSN